MARIMKFADKIKKIKRTGMVNFKTDDGEYIEFKVESRSDKAVDEINQKYESLKPNVPTKRLPSKNGVKIVEDPDNKEYRIELARNQKMNFAELALLFLADEDKPEGELEEQLQQIMDVELAGFIGKIVQRGLQISGIIDEPEEDEIEEAKNV